MRRVAGCRGWGRHTAEDWPPRARPPDGGTCACAGRRGRVSLGAVWGERAASEVSVGWVGGRDGGAERRPAVAGHGSDDACEGRGDGVEDGLQSAGVA